jgi:hypothetical protein
MDIKLYMSATYFVDSHGGLHMSCPPEHPEAAPFGPTGASRKVTEEPILRQFGSYTEALKRGALNTEGEWDVCAERAWMGPTVGRGIELLVELLLGRALTEDEWEAVRDAATWTLDP